MNGGSVWAVILVGCLLALLFMARPAHSACRMSYCKDSSMTSAPTRVYITNKHRQIVGDFYDPGTGRIQIRDTSRRIVGYVERSGRITNLHRQKIGAINE